MSNENQRDNGDEREAGVVTDETRDPFDADTAPLRPRAYVLTGGRTRPVMDLPIETLLAPTSKGISSMPRLTAENQRIMDTCTRSSQSVAEVSAHLKLALGVTRVLAADLISHGLMKATVPSYHSQNKERLDKQVLERVLHGLEDL